MSITLLMIYLEHSYTPRGELLRALRVRRVFVCLTRGTTFNHYKTGKKNRGIPTREKFKKRRKRFSPVCRCGTSFDLPVFASFAVLGIKAFVSLFGLFPSFSGLFVRTTTANDEWQRLASAAPSHAQERGQKTEVMIENKKTTKKYKYTITMSALEKRDG